MSTLVIIGSLLLTFGALRLPKLMPNLKLALAGIVIGSLITTGGALYFILHSQLSPVIGYYLGLFVHFLLLIFRDRKQVRNA